MLGTTKLSLGVLTGSPDSRLAKLQSFLTRLQSPHVGCCSSHCGGLLKKKDDFCSIGPLYLDMSSLALQTAFSRLLVCSPLPVVACKCFGFHGSSVWEMRILDVGLEGVYDAYAIGPRKTRLNTERMLHLDYFDQYHDTFEARRIWACKQFWNAYAPQVLRSCSCPRGKIGRHFGRMNKGKKV